MIHFLSVMATTSPYSRNTSSSSGVILRQCPRCDYASSQKSNLTRHFESIHITFKCRECQTATYTGRKTIIDHVKRNHKGANEKYDFKDASSEVIC